MPLHLTFDDGPSPTWTPAVLRALDAAGAGATFFVLGEAVRRRPDLLDRILDAGHRVELHGDRHVRHDRLSTDEIRRDARSALGVLASRGVRPAWWRTPWGRITDGTREVADELELRLIGWDADTHDWRGDDAATMLAAVRRDVRDGGVVLAHDALGPGATRDGCAETVALVPLVAAWAAERGLDLTPLPAPVAAGVAPW